MPDALPFPLRHGPPRRDAATGAWTLTRRADVAAVLAAPGTTMADPTAMFVRTAAAAGIDAAPVMRLPRTWAVFLDPPQHAAVRAWMVAALRLLAPAFTPAAVAAAVAELIGADARELDVDAVAARLPAMLLARGLGVRPERIESIAAIGTRLSATWHAALTLRLVRAAVADAAALDAALAALLADSGAAAVTALLADADAPAVSALLADVVAPAAAALLGEADAPLVAALPQAPGVDPRHALGFLVIAATETTAAIAANALALCLADRAARALAEQRRIGDLIRRAGPFRFANARTAGPLEGALAAIPPGAAIAIELVQANHDPAAFPDPFAIVAERSERALAFGLGAHACIGAAVARDVLGGFLTAVLARNPRLVGAAPAWTPHAWLHRVANYAVEIDAADATCGNRRGLAG